MKRQSWKSINMNINEIIANVALLNMGEKPGSYHIIDPIEQANIFQSTNDIVPSAITHRVARYPQREPGRCHLQP
ncbi:MAG: hypothetical protein Q8M08_09725 [Bacteroidales bacterium]|nr:hypothetical protein [Bacteroidales bacterium]